jgi:histidine decarboxylase
VWPEEAPSHHDLDDEGGMNNPLSGRINVDDLKKMVRVFLEHGYPILIVLNVGSTWKCAYDDVPAVNEMLKELGEDFPWLWEREVDYDGVKDVRRGFWVHVDGALGAAYLPFLEMAHERGLIKEKKKYNFPIFDFRNDAVMSICCSMHKWFGSPWPGAVYLTRTGHQLSPPTTPSYIGAADTTLGGSRNAFSPVIFWDYFSRHSYEDSMYAALKAEDVAAYLEQKLRDLEAYLKELYPAEAPHIDLWVARSEYALAVRFRQVNPTISYKYTVDSEWTHVPISETEQELRAYSHVFAMQSVDMNLVNSLIKDIREAAEGGDWHDAFPTWIDHQRNPGERTPIPSAKPGKSHHIMRVPFTGRGFGSLTFPSERD